MSFTEAQKVDIRRYCGYGVYGVGPSGFQGWRFFQAFGLLEYRMNNLDPTEETVILARVADLNTLEAAIPSAGANLDTDEAAVWKHNKNEVADRMRLYNLWRRELCGIINVPPGPNLKGGNSMRMVV